MLGLTPESPGHALSTPGPDWNLWVCMGSGGYSWVVPGCVWATLTSLSSSPASRPCVGWTLGEWGLCFLPSGLSHWEPQWAVRAWEGEGPELSLAVSLSGFLPHCLPLTILNDGASDNPLLADYPPWYLCFMQIFCSCGLLFFFQTVFYLLLKS